MSSEVQIAVIDQQDTQIVLAVPGVQGATGSEIAAGGTANQVLRKASGTDYATDWSLVTSAMIEDGAIVDADVNASAAIAGTKISPNFGSQAVVTTGTSTAASFIPTSNTAPTNGLYLPAANNVAISTNGTGKLFVDANGRVGVGNSSMSSFTANAGDNLVVGAGASSEGITIYSGTSGQGSISFADGVVGDAAYRGYIAYNHTADALQLATAGSECLRITSTGELRHIGGGSVNSPGVYFAGSAPSNSLYVQATTGNVGLGTNSPSGKLDIVTGTTGNVLIDAEAGSNFHAKVVNDSGDLHVGTRSTSADTFLVSNRRIYLRTGAAESNALFVNESGNVGIGTTSPGNKLTVIDRTTPIALRVGENDSATTEAGLRIQARNTANTTAYSLDISVDADEAAATFDFGGEERARITSDGKLLVGTSSSISGGDTNALIQVAHSSGANLCLGTNQSTVSSGFRLGEITFKTNAGGSYHSTAVINCAADADQSTGDYPSRLVFSTTADGLSSPTPRMTITNAGYMLIGNISSLPSASVFGLGLLKDGTGGAIYSSRNNTGSTAHVEFYNPNGKVGSISTNGSATAYNTSSDYRLKENVVPLTGAADRLKQIPVHRFNFIADPDKTVDGFIAHEAQAVVPECVTGAKDEVDEEGNPVYQGIDQSKLVPLLTAALQEALAEIESLKARVTALEP
jgi:hypothetical protein